MAESDKNKDPAAVEASMSMDESSQDDVTETPMLAVWLVLGAILCAGLYGLYLGKSAHSQPKTETGATSSYFELNPMQLDAQSTVNWSRLGRLS